MCLTDLMGAVETLLPIEVKVNILRYLSTADVKRTRLVNKEWSFAGGFFLSRTTYLQLNESSLERIKDGGFGCEFRSFRIGYLSGENQSTFHTYSEKVLSALMDKGDIVSKLIFEGLMAPPRQTTLFLQELFKITGNVTEISTSCSGIFGHRLLAPLPTLPSCTRICWDSGKETTPSEFILAATPNVKILLHPNPCFLSPLKLKDGSGTVLYWNQLRTIQNCIPPLIHNLNRPLCQLSLDYIPPQMHLFSMMGAVSGTLQILQLQGPPGGKSPHNIRNNEQKPVMPFLHTLSVTDFSADCESEFLFGNWRNPYLPKLDINKHLPVLTNLRFRIHNKQKKDAENWMILLNIFPILLLKNMIYPSIVHLDLTWPPYKSDPKLWNDWSRRVLARFPQVIGNEELDKVKGFDPNETIVVDEVERQLEKFHRTKLLAAYSNLKFY